jgi:transposase
VNIPLLQPREQFADRIHLHQRLAAGDSNPAAGGLEEGLVFKHLLHQMIHVDVIATALQSTGWADINALEALGAFVADDFVGRTQVDRLLGAGVSTVVTADALLCIIGWVLALVAGHDLVKGERIGVDGSTMEANAALRTIVRRDNGETYREMLVRMAQESGIDTPTIDDLVRLDRKRKGKKLSNADWASKTDPDAKVARMKNGSTRLAYKPEHAVDLDTGVIVAAPIHPADKGDTTTLDATLETAARNLADIGLAPTSGDPCDLVTDKGYHSRELLKGLDGDIWKTRIAEPAPPNGYLRWHGDEAAQKAVYANRSRLKSAVGRKAMRKRGEMVERSFAHVLDRGGMRRAWLRGRENVHKRYLIHVAGFNLGILMRALFGCGTPRGARGASKAFLFVVQTDVALVIALVAEFDGERAMLLIVFTPEGADRPG